MVMRNEHTKLKHVFRFLKLNESYFKKTKVLLKNYLQAGGKKNYPRLRIPSQGA